MSLLDSISFERLLWLVPVLLAVHNLEEAPFMADWAGRLPIKLPLRVTTRQFVIAVTLLTIAVFIGTYIALEHLPASTGYRIVLGIQAVLLFNAFVPHMLGTIGFRLYCPGVITAVALILPFSAYLFHRAVEETILSWLQLWTMLAIAPVVVVFVAGLSLGAAKLFDPRNLSSAP